MHKNKNLIIFCKILENSNRDFDSSIKRVGVGSCISFSRPKTYTRLVYGPHSYLSELQHTSL